MRLDRNITNPRRGKYAVVKLRNVEQLGDNEEVQRALQTLHQHNVLDFGDTAETDFFLIRLKDKYAAPALAAYAGAAMRDDRDYALDVFNLAHQASQIPPQNPT